MRNDRQNLIVELTFNFSLKIIDFSESLRKVNYHLADQIFRSGTSIGANVREAQNAESKKDFIHKLKIAAKEGDEVQYWLELCSKSSHLPSNKELLSDIESIIKVLSKIISTSKNGAKIGQLSNHQIIKSKQNVRQDWNS
ncbi:four helix bundle protein [Fulvivirga lutea]|uniref:Four helix bundle protein n=1 Tax=Fulvivirga lutea TaxID=2810512 RepID=A0A974WFL9_9BACT|nr:four helix bundle protein [Fulvivirga lutea]QSE96859.1 four helix bundle protein [Fulvivirga lutea]